MDRGKDHAFSIPHSTVTFVAAVLGNTTSAPTIPADGRYLPTTSTYPKRANGVDQTTAGAPSRTSQGIYVITFKHKLVNILFVNAQVLSAGASPTGILVADCTIVDPVARTVTVKVSTPSGTLTDLGTSDLLVMQFTAQDSSA